MIASNVREVANAVLTRAAQVKQFADDGAAAVGRGDFGVSYESYMTAYAGSHDLAVALRQVDTPELAQFARTFDGAGGEFMLAALAADSARTSATHKLADEALAPGIAAFTEAMTGLRTLVDAAS